MIHHATLFVFYVLQNRSGKDANSLMVANWNDLSIDDRLPIRVGDWKLLGVGNGFHIVFGSGWSEARALDFQQVHSG